MVRTCGLVHVCCHHQWFINIFLFLFSQKTHTYKQQSKWLSCQWHDFWMQLVKTFHWKQVRHKATHNWRPIYVPFASCADGWVLKKETKISQPLHVICKIPSISSSPKKCSTKRRSLSSTFKCKLLLRGKFQCATSFKSNNKKKNN